MNGLRLWLRHWRSRISKRLLTRSFYPKELAVRDQPEHYGVISYMPSSNAAGYANLGDEFQSLAAAQFLPRIDAYVPRDQLDQAFPRQIRTKTKRLVLIMAARFFDAPGCWPPPSYIHPVFVGFRIESSRESAFAAYLTPSGLDYLRRHGPIGCRDLETYRALEARGVPVILTGCVTLTLQRSRYLDANLVAQQQVLAINLPDSVFAALPAEIRARSRRLVQELPLSALQTQLDRTRAANDRLRELASAALVITNRLHGALPCVAFGTPVVVVDCGETDLESRSAGLASMVHWFRTQDADFSQRFTAFPWLHPPPNPDPDLHATLVKRSTAMLTW